jgi:hypothetical protein
VSDLSSPGFVVQILARTPDVRLGVFGRPVQAILSRPGVILARMTDQTMRVEKFEYIDADRDLGQLKLTVDNWDHYFFEHPAWVSGNLIRFFWGYPGRIQGPKYAIIDSVRGHQKLEIRCMEQAALSNVAKDRLWKNTTRALIVAKLVQEGAFPGVTKVQIGSARPAEAKQFQLGVAVSAALSIPSFESLLQEKPRDFQQSQLSNWEFCRRLSLEIGYEVFVEDDILHFHPRLLDRKPIKKYEWFTGSGELLDFQLQNRRVLDRAGQYEVSGRDPIAMENLSATGSNETTNRNTLGREGSTAQKTALRPNGSDGSLLLGKTKVATPRSDAAAVENLADAYFRGAEQGEIEATAEVIGDPALKKARLVRITGISRALSGNFYVEQISHRIDRSGYRCNLKLIRNALTALPTTDAPLLDPETTKNNDESPSSGRKITSTQVGDLKAQ